MTESWFHRIEGDMQRAVSRFHHEGHSITAEHLQPQEPA